MTQRKPIQWSRSKADLIWTDDPLQTSVSLRFYFCQEYYVDI